MKTNVEINKEKELIQQKERTRNKISRKIKELNEQCDKNLLKTVLKR